MTRNERLALLAVHAAVLTALLGTRDRRQRPAPAPEPPDGRAPRADVETLTGFAPRRVALRAGTLLATIAALFVTTVFVPLLGVTLFVVSAAATTGAAAALNASRLRR